jgi:hypothetical protein
MISASNLIDPASASFSTAFPHLVPGVLRRQRSREEIRQRALSEMWALASSARRGLEYHDDTLDEEMVNVFIRRAFSGDLLHRFDPTLSSIDGYLHDQMKWIGLECLRARRQRRMEASGDQALVSCMKPGPARIAEDKDSVQHIRRCATLLPPKERDAVARRYTALADLDSGAAIRNECVVRHRGLMRLRAMVRA